MQYKTKSRIIEAIKFEYSEQGIKDLKEFLGKYLGNITKARCLNSVGEAQLLKDYGDQILFHTIIYEGEYVIKEGNKFRICKSSEFESQYECDDNILVKKDELVIIKDGVKTTLKKLEE